MHCIFWSVNILSFLFFARLIQLWIDKYLLLYPFTHALTQFSHTTGQPELVKKYGRSGLLHLCIRALLEYRSRNGDSLPDQSNKAQVVLCVCMSVLLQYVNVWLCRLTRLWPLRTRSTMLLTQTTRCPLPFVCLSFIKNHAFTN